MAWTQKQRDRQKYNYTVYRKLGYGPKFARKMRNRSPETTLDIIDYEVKKEHRERYKKPLRKKDFPKVPQSLMTRTKRKGFTTWLQTNMGLTKQQASHFNRLGIEKQLVMRRRLKGFIKVVQDTHKQRTGKTLSRKKALKEVWKEMEKYTPTAFFDALRAYYESHVGVRAE